MAIFLDWFASHNTLVIQSLAAVVALLIVVLIFRLLFANQEATAEGLAKNVTYAQLEEKLNKLLEQQSQMKVSVNAASEGAVVTEALGADAMTALSGDADPAAASGAAAVAANDQIAELSRLRAEISTLKDSLKRKEVEITTAKEQAVQSVNTDQQDSKLAELSGKITDYEKEIETLKSRLSDYEIIAEDIADLQAYKKENQKLKNQLANQAPEQTVAEETPTADSVSETSLEDELAALVAEPEPAVQPIVEENSTVGDEMQALLDQDIIEEPIVPDDILTSANDILNDISASETQDEIMPEALPADELDNDESREVSKDVKKEEKVLLDEFEKHFAKDED